MARVDHCAVQGWIRGVEAQLRVVTRAVQLVQESTLLVQASRVDRLELRVAGELLAGLHAWVAAEVVLRVHLSDEAGIASQAHPAVTVK